MDRSPTARLLRFRMRQKRRNEPPAPELHTTLTNIDPQLQSLFFDGTFPPEIRDTIFSFAFTDDLDLTKPYPKDTHYTRPGHTHRRKSDISLMLTCKRIYAETYHLPLLMKTHTFFFRSPDRVPQGIHNPESYFSDLLPTQHQFLQTFHIFVQQYWLESGFLPLCQRDVMKNVVHLTMTLRRSDWWDWEQDVPLAITPYAPFPANQPRSNDAKVMKEMWEEDAQNPSIQRKFNPSYWGSAFQHLPKLKTLTIEFETENFCEKEIDDVAKHAVQAWKFPMGEKGVLSAEGSEVQKWEWKGPKCMLSYSQAADLEKQSKSPILVVRAVRWKLV